MRWSRDAGEKLWHKVRKLPLGFLTIEVPSRSRGNANADDEQYDTATGTRGCRRNANVADVIIRDVERRLARRFAGCFGHRRRRDIEISRFMRDARCQIAELRHDGVVRVGLRVSV
ncbi:hypothetical protein [Afipia sp. Root123D2]|uniref:hypothetical protein n=1 Tax=Afipia sp. Root123D2 TaxID=1736436 RepID=UPI0012E976AA|nr:hypothetical protein [Afipia sp. Root123D2]